ncbi:IS21-like element helper ATPase IstB [Rhodocytophaga aerolata]|uniref:IS21-like element helper ATPase IstB n=1 Tax=Rhodocytophaga aerolata TaxID=455078 RepID=A0ABT8RI76_9BACT|nr:IS21-like element helper ATPase IstB [Rhodocytophaga aerolata]MDO1450868.1 IS21-like element helper ATPase IstB [Rhodocytophaga aerolata]
MNNQATLQRMQQLKLQGMAQAFEAILHLPVQQHPATDQLLAQLLDAEYEHRHHQKTKTAIRSARFRYQASLEEVHFLPTRNLDQDQWLRLADCSFIKRAENIFFTGAAGCGKSFLASALGYQACRLGYRVAYYHLPKLLEKLHVAKADASYSRELAKLEKQQLLILDDWGLQPLDQPGKLALLQIMEDRHGKAATIITSQLPVKAWYDYIADPTLADAILDRLLHQAHRFELKGDSLRKKIMNQP